MEFPILGLVDNDNMLYVFENDKHLKNTSLELYNRRGSQPNERYIDSKGNIFKVKRVKNLGYKGLFGFSLLLKGRQIRIETEFYPVSEVMDLQEVKKIISERVDKKKGFWQSSWDIGELKQKINNAESFKNLFLLLK